MTATSLHTASTARTAEGNETAVASFIIGLLGLFIFNIFLGPLAIVLGGRSLAKGTARRGRALTGIALGLADLAVLGVLLVTHRGSVAWPPGA